MLTIDLESYKIPLARKGKLGFIDEDLTKWPMNSLVHAFKYGVRQLTNDAIADKYVEQDGKKVAIPNNELIATAEKRLAALRIGELRVKRESVVYDPFETECVKIYFERLDAAFKATNAYDQVPKKTKGRIMWLLNASREKRKLEAFEEPLDAWDALETSSPKMFKEISDQANENLAKLKSVDLKELGL